MENCTAALKVLLRHLNVKFTEKYLRHTVLSHPDHPSILAIIDTLDKYKIDSLALKVDDKKLERLPLPAIIQLNEDGSQFFYVLVNFRENSATYITGKKRKKKVSKDDFLKSWTGVCLVVEKSIHSGEVNIRKKRIAQGISRVLGICAVILLTIWISIQFSKSGIAKDFTKSMYTLLYTFVKLGGLLVGLLLLWFEVDEHNPTLQKFCSGGKKVNCSSVLNSKYAKFLDGNISLGSIAFSYFFGSFAYLIITLFSSSSLSVLAFFSFVSLPIVLASVYYQAFVIGQWCRFCLFLGMALILEILLVSLGKFYRGAMDFEALPLFFALILIPVLGWKLTKPLLEKEKQLNLYRSHLSRIKYNPNVLKGLLAKSRKIKNDPHGLGISIKKTDAKYNVIKVCNPYCGPCARAHPVFMELIRKGKINMQILFRSNPDLKDSGAELVKHFLAIDDLGGENNMRQALDDWYGSKSKDFTSFAIKYPVNTELDLQESKVKDMWLWCQMENITHTPAIFIDGNELPKEYDVLDLKEVLT